MAKVNVKFVILPGGVVQGLGVTDAHGKPVNSSKCRKVLLDVGSEFGPVDAKSVKPIVSKVMVNQDADLHLE